MATFSNTHVEMLLKCAGAGDNADADSDSDTDRDAFAVMDSDDDDDDDDMPRVFRKLVKTKRTIEESQTYKPSEKRLRI